MILGRLTCIKTKPIKIIKQPRKILNLPKIIELILPAPYQFKAISPSTISISASIQLILENDKNIPPK